MRPIDVFRFWLPLFASWLLMMTEGPLISAAVNRLPDEIVMLAALGIVIGLSILIESPVINLLSTATALVHDRPSYLQVRRFTVHWIVLVTMASALLAFTPLFELVVVRAMAVPEEVARWVRPGLQVLVPWSGVIAWRRFLQGVMIHFGNTRQVGFGSALRVSSVIAVVAGLLWLGDVPGVIVGSAGFMAGVTAEAIYATIIVRGVLRRMPDADPAEEPLTYRALLAFHLPLAGTAFLTLFIQPVVSFALARLDQPTLSLAAWPVIMYLLMVMRAGALALPEAVISLHKKPDSRPALDRFSLWLTAMNLGAMVLLVATPLVDLYLLDVQNVTAEIAGLARLGLLLFVPMPAMATLVAWRRGLLMARRRTPAVNVAMAVRLVVFIVVLTVGVLLDWRGIPTAAWATNLSIVAELLYLAGVATPRSAQGDVRSTAANR